MLTEAVSFFRRQRVSRKLMALGLVAAAASVALVGAVIMAFDIHTEYADETRELSIMGAMAGLNSSAAMAFRDSQAAGEILGALRADPHVIGAAIQLPDGAVIATFHRDPAHPIFTVAPGPPHTALREQLDLRTGRFLVVVPVVSNGQEIGAVSVLSDLDELRNRVIDYLGVLAFALLGGFALSYVLSHRLQQLIAAPLLRLTEVTRQVTRDHRYSRRADAGDPDEIGEIGRAHV